MADVEKRTPMSAEHARLEDSSPDTPGNWKAIGPYLSERAWGRCVRTTVPMARSGNISHTNRRSRAYRWNEDGLAGLCDRAQRLCFALAFWNGRDPFLKERIFGLSGPEGNHGEDPKSTGGTLTPHRQVRGCADVTTIRRPNFLMRCFGRRTQGAPGMSPNSN
jgi:hypothetical protein